LRLRVLVLVRGFKFKSEKGSVKGRRLCARVRGGRSLRGWKSQESRRSLRPGFKRLGGKRGGWLSGWDEAAGASIQGRNGFVAKRKSGEGKGNLSTIIREEKSSEGRSPRVLRTERGPQGYRG